MISYALEEDPDLAIYARLYGVTGSKHCSVDVNTALYDWDYSQFCALERYVDFCNDREYWGNRGQRQDEKLQEAKNKVSR